MTAVEEMAKAMASIAADSRMNMGVTAMAQRRSDFRDSNAMMLSGIGVVAESRRVLNAALTRYWDDVDRVTLDQSLFPEVIIGSGVHAAIYAATRVRNGYPKPLVLERSNRVGGNFAMSDAPSFYLNSGNRPGLVGLPSNGQALNYLPGAPIQPSDVSLSEYQTNADISFVTRVTLAQYADVVPGVTVNSWTPRYLSPSRRIDIQLSDGRVIYARRLIDARGLGDPIRLGSTTATSDRVMTFPEFAATIDNPFPLRGMRRVAVIGGGDSGKCAVEALLGIGPSSGMSTAALDYVESIDWYARGLDGNCEAWLRNQRKRYARIGSYLGTGRLNVINRSADVAPSFDSVYVQGQSYDKVITATGYMRPTLNDDYDTTVYRVGGQVVARRISDLAVPVFTIGPASEIEFAQRELEQSYTNRDENRVAIFRYAPRTATLATALDDPADDSNA